MINRQLYVVDTGYLLELYRVPDHSDEASSLEIKRRLAAALETKSEFYVPVPVLFELGNHIANMKKSGGRARADLAARLRNDIVTSCESREPWVITAFGSENVAVDFSEALLAYCTGFAEEFAAASVGLTDVAVIREAEHLKRRFKSDGSRKYKIHIWTRDGKVKAREPDKEENAFV